MGNGDPQKIISETLVTPGLWTTRVQSEKTSYMLKFQIDSISSKFCSKCRSWERILNFFTSNYWALRKKCAHFLGIRKFFDFKFSIKILFLRDDLQDFNQLTFGVDLTISKINFRTVFQIGRKFQSLIKCAHFFLAPNLETFR